MRRVQVAVLLFSSAFANAPSIASPLVTGNGFGFAVVSADTGSVSTFYAHPYRFAEPDKQNPLSEGVETANFIRSSVVEERRRG